MSDKQYPPEDFLHKLRDIDKHVASFYIDELHKPGKANEMALKFLNNLAGLALDKRFKDQGVACKVLRMLDVFVDHDHYMVYCKCKNEDEGLYVVFMQFDDYVPDGPIPVRAAIIQTGDNKSSKLFVRMQKLLTDLLTNMTETEKALAHIPDSFIDKFNKQFEE